MWVGGLLGQVAVVSGSYKIGTYLTLSVRSCVHEAYVDTKLTCSGSECIHEALLWALVQRSHTVDAGEMKPKRA